MSSIWNKIFEKHLFTCIIVRHIITKMDVSLREYPKEHLPDEKNGGLRRGIKKKLCVQCKFHESIFFCIGCSQDVLGTMVHICNPKRDGGRNCWKQLHDSRACITSDRQKLSKKRKLQSSNQRKAKRKRVSLNPLFDSWFGSNFISKLTNGI